MIRINLLGDKVDRSLSNFLQVTGFCAAVVICLISCMIIQVNLSGELHQASEEKADKEQLLAQLKKKTREVQDLEKKKEHLREKLLTIAELKANKRGPVRVLDQLNDAIPERAWIESVKEKNNTLYINGVALDNQTISLFMHELEEAPYFKNVELAHSTHFILKDVQLKQFSLSAEIESALQLQKEKEEARKKAELVTESNTEIREELNVENENEVQQEKVEEVKQEI